MPWQPLQVLRAKREEEEVAKVAHHDIVAIARHGGVAHATRPMAGPHAEGNSA
jgi:hypothetical protein